MYSFNSTVNIHHSHTWADTIFALFFLLLFLLCRRRRRSYEVENRKAKFIYSWRKIRKHRNSNPVDFLHNGKDFIGWGRFANYYFIHHFSGCYRVPGFTHRWCNELENKDAQTRSARVIVVDSSVCWKWFLENNLCCLSRMNWDRILLRDRNQ